MTPEEIKKVEDLVNQKIEENLSVRMEEMNLKEAKEQGATGVFQERYGERVKVYSIGPSARASTELSRMSSGPPFSREICGGPHVKNTAELGHFKIVKEESVAEGIRRIRAVLD
jgi:alanyl-tRNA synthetase